MRAALSVSIVALFSWTLALVHVRGEPIDKPEFPSPESILRKVAGRARAQRIAAPARWAAMIAPGLDGAAGGGT